MDFGASACLADPNQKSLITTGAGVRDPICGDRSWLVAPGTYDVVTVDGLGGNHLRSGYSSIRITLEPGQKLEIITRPDRQ
jgi:hypothetical protein